MTNHNSHIQDEHWQQVLLPECYCTKTAYTGEVGMSFGSWIRGMMHLDFARGNCRRAARKVVLDDLGTKDDRFRIVRLWDGKRILESKTPQ